MSLQCGYKIVLLSNLYSLSNGRHVLQGECCKAVWTLFVDEILDAKREDEMAMTDIQLQSSLTAG